LGRSRLKNYLFRIGSFELRWYSLAYLAGILLAYWHVSKMIKAPGAPMAQRHVDDLFFYCTLASSSRAARLRGLLCAGAVRPAARTAQAVNGGMSFHGGLIGTVVAIAWVAWRAGLSFLRVCDYIGSACRSAVFWSPRELVNGELVGPRRPIRGALGDGLHRARRTQPRIPARLYEAALEGWC
jgi:phosphatidylglycerol:prolipoprotein diacylglycerol transferase